MMLELWYQPPRYVCNARTVDVKLLPYTSWLSVWIWIKMQPLSFTTNVSCNNTTESKVRLHHELPHQCCRWAAASKSCTTPPFSSTLLIFLVSTILSRPIRIDDLPTNYLTSICVDNLSNLFGYVSPRNSPTDATMAATSESRPCGSLLCMSMWDNFVAKRQDLKWVSMPKQNAQITYIDDTSLKNKYRTNSCCSYTLFWNRSRIVGYD